MFCHAEEILFHGAEQTGGQTICWCVLPRRPSEGLAGGEFTPHSAGQGGSECALSRWWWWWWMRLHSLDDDDDKESIYRSWVCDLIGHPSSTQVGHMPADLERLLQILFGHSAFKLLGTTVTFVGVLGVAHNQLLLKLFCPVWNAGWFLPSSFIVATRGDSWPEWFQRADGRTWSSV